MESNTPNTLIEEMRPHEIQRVAAGSSVVFIPVSPCFEWHSFHLPLGTDGIIAEGVARRLAERFDGCYFRCLSCGLDANRTDEEKRAWGLPAEKDVFGMHFPGLPVMSEYCRSPLMVELLNDRLTAVRGSGFHFAFLINVHNGRGQNQTCQQAAADACVEGFHCESLFIGTFAHGYAPADPAHKMHLRVGGHAGLSETHHILAFRPDLADLTRVPPSPFSVATSGILHNVPSIPDEFSPRHALQKLADEWRENLLGNMASHVEARIGHR